MSKIEVVAVLDVGKTNKKLFLFDKQYQIVYQQKLSFGHKYDEDGYECEDLAGIKEFLFTTLRALIVSEKYIVKAINFSTYGASLVHVGDDGFPVVDMFNYLKPYPDGLLKQMFVNEDAQTKFELETCCPIQGNLNSGLQLYRIYHQRKEIFSNTVTSLHFPQYLSFLMTGKKYSDITSIGCHTSLWNFQTNDYHEWLSPLGIKSKLAPVVSNDTVEEINFDNQPLLVGIGIHDSSAALVPYLKTMDDPFILISTGTWSVSFNPFNNQALTKEELKNGCLCYMNYLNKPVKASRVFLGSVFEKERQRIASFFNIAVSELNAIEFSKSSFDKIKVLDSDYDVKNDFLLAEFPFAKKDLIEFANYQQAYLHLMYELLQVQLIFINMIDPENVVKDIFIDGGFGNNQFFIQALSHLLEDKKIYATQVSESTALGAALIIHDCWNETPIDKGLIKLIEY